MTQHILGHVDWKRVDVDHDHMHGLHSHTQGDHGAGTGNHGYLHSDSDHQRGKRLFSLARPPGPVRAHTESVHTYQHTVVQTVVHERRSRHTHMIHDLARGKVPTRKPDAHLHGSVPGLANHHNASTSTLDTPIVLLHTVPRAELHVQHRQRNMLTSLTVLPDHIMPDTMGPLSDTERYNGILAKRVRRPGVLATVVPLHGSSQWEDYGGPLANAMCRVWTIISSLSSFAKLLASARNRSAPTHADVRHGTSSAPVTSTARVDLPSVNSTLHHVCRKSDLQAPVTSSRKLVVAFVRLAVFLQATLCSHSGLFPPWNSTKTVSSAS